MRTERKSEWQCLLKCEGEDQPAAEALAPGSLPSQGIRGVLDVEMASIITEGRQKGEQEKEIKKPMSNTLTLGLGLELELFRVSICPNLPRVISCLLVFIWCPQS